MAHIGSIATKILIKVADGEPVEIGSLHIPIAGGPDLRIGEGIHVDGDTLMLNIAAALDDAAQRIRKDHHYKTQVLPKKNLTGRGV